MANGAPIWFATYLNNAGLKNGQAEADRIFNKLQGSAKDAGSGIEVAMKKAGAAVGAYLSVNALADFARQVVTVRGEMQGLGLAFETMLGSKAKADKMMADVIDFAQKTPFTVTDVASNVKQLIAMGAAGDDVMKTFKTLGDVAAGVNVPISRIAINFGQVAALGKLQGREIRDFAMAGIPIVDELAQMYGVAQDEIMGMVEAGKIGFPDVQKAFEAMAGAGGRFNNMMEKLNSTVSGQMSRLQDQIEQMFNKIGAANEGVIYGAISGAASLVENYEKVGKILLEIAAVYGTYKAVLIGINAYNKAATVYESAKAVAQRASAISGSQLSAANVLLARTQAAVNKTMLANPYVLAAAAVAALAFGIYKLITYQTDAEKAQSRLNKAMGEADAASAQEISSLARLKGELSAAAKGTDEYNKIKDKIVSGYGKYHDGLAEEIEKAGLLDSTYQSLTKSIQASFGARQYEQFMKSEMENLDNVMSENLTKIQDRLTKKLGDEKGAAVYSKILSGVIDGSVTATLAGIKGLDAETVKLLDNVAGFEGGVFDISNRRVESLVLEIQRAQKLTDEIDKKARERFGITRDAAVSDTSTPTSAATTTTSIDKDTANRLEKQAKDLADTQRKYEDEVAQARVDAMNNGLEKVLAQNELNFQREKAQIEEEYAKLSDVERQFLIDAAKTRKDAADKSAKNAILEDMMTFTQRYEKIITDSNVKIKEAQMAGASLDMFGVLSDQENEAINRLAEEYAAKSTDYEAFMRSVADASIEEIQAHINNAESLISQIIEGGIGKEEIEKYLGYVARLNSLKDQLKNDKPDTSPDKESERDWKKLYSTLQKVANEFEEIGDAIGGTAGEVIKLAGNIATSTLQGINAITQLANWSVTATKMAAEGAAASMTAVEKASVILTVISGAIKVVTAITGIFKDNEEQLRKAADAAKGYERALREIDVNRRLGIHESVFGTDVIGQFTTAVEIAAESLKTINDVAAGLDLSSFFDQLKAGEIDVFDFIERANGIEATFDGRSKWNKFVGSGNHKIKNYAFDINKFINTDGSLKLEELQDWLNQYGEGLEEWEKEIVKDLISAGDEYVKAQEAQTAYLNELWGSLAGSIADNMIDAFLETGDAASNLGDLVEDVAKNMAKSMIESMLTDDVTGIFNGKLQNDVLNLLKDGDQEGANNLIKNAIESAGQLAPYFQTIMESVGLVAGVAEDAANEARTSASQGFAQASQDSIDKIDGILTNIQNHTYGIFELMKSGGSNGSGITLSALEAPVLNIADMMRTNQQIQQANTDNILGRLTNIDMNTRPIAEMQKDIHYMRGRTDDMADSLDKFTRG